MVNLWPFKVSLHVRLLTSLADHSAVRRGRRVLRKSSLDAYGQDNEGSRAQRWTQAEGEKDSRYAHAIRRLCIHPRGPAACPGHRVEKLGRHRVLCGGRRTRSVRRHTTRTVYAQD
jgi:hypothetical protein